MISYLISSLAGRVATVLCIFVILLPYGLRRNHSGPYLDRLWPHIWLGYLLLVLSIIHAGTDTAAMARANPNGVWGATIAFLLLLVEVILGLQLCKRRLIGRKAVRRFHFWTMAAFVTALGLHLWLNAR
jgi:hypothetical protein